MKNILNKLKVILNKFKDIFKNKIILIVLSVIILIIVLLIIFYSIFSSSLKIIGKEKVQIEYQEEYKDLGAKFKIFNIDLTKKIKVKNNINNKKIGSYKVVYSVRYFIFNIKKTRIVSVVDKIEPVINLKGEDTVSICPNATYNEEGYEAIDEYDGDITSKVKRSVTPDGNILYEVNDSSGNKVEKIRKIISEDKTSPKLKLKGNSTIYVKVNSGYNDLGVEVTDNCDVKVNVETKNYVNINSTGRYTIEYIATDSSGNTASISRNVIVYSNEGTGVVYLTFDDGPSSTGSTEKILNILKNEGVKATFFVTSGGPDYLIKREYDEGHRVALHTSTHDYSYVYSSVDNYFSDLLTVKNRVYRITGYSANIIRFPGGSNNTVSNRYYNGIMDILTNEVINKGYTYFDWNVSSGDAGICYSSDCVYNNVVNSLSKNRINVVLMHDIKSYTADALKDIIDYCKLNGYTFKVIDENTTPIRFK